MDRRTFDELANDPTWRDYNTLRRVTRIPSGETMLEVQTRAVRSLLELVPQHRGNALAIVSHADVIRGTIGHVLGIPVDNLLRISIEPASVSTIAFRGTWPQLLGVNRTG